MARITLRQLLDHAAEHDYGVPAFNINNMEQAPASRCVGQVFSGQVFLVEFSWSSFFGLSFLNLSFLGHCPRTV
jgi:hypothetical protein